MVPEETDDCAVAVAEVLNDPMGRYGRCVGAQRGRVGGYLCALEGKSALDAGKQ